MKHVVTIRPECRDLYQHVMEAAGVLTGSDKPERLQELILTEFLEKLTAGDKKFLSDNHFPLDCRNEANQGRLVDSGEAIIDAYVAELNESQGR